MEYTEQVMDHFMNPRNMGEMDDASGVGTVGNAKCGDIMRIYIKVENDVITDVKFKTFGCGAAIATSSKATEIVKGMREGDQQDGHGGPGRAAAGEGALFRAGRGGPARRYPGLPRALGKGPEAEDRGGRRGYQVRVGTRVDLILLLWYTVRGREGLNDGLYD